MHNGLSGLTEGYNYIWLLRETINVVLNIVLLSCIFIGSWLFYDMIFLSNKD